VLGKDVAIQPLGTRVLSLLERLVGHPTTTAAAAAAAVVVVVVVVVFVLPIRTNGDCERDAGPLAGGERVSYDTGGVHCGLRHLHPLLRPRTEMGRVRLREKGRGKGGLRRQAEEAGAAEEEEAGAAEPRQRGTAGGGLRRGGAS
jgi:hypothetical protein